MALGVHLVFILNIIIFYTRPTRSTVRLVLDRTQQGRALGPSFSGVKILGESFVGFILDAFLYRSEPKRVEVPGQYAHQLIEVFSVSWDDIGVAGLKHDVF